ncbi:MAG TPA: response regulator transcription factor [Verrucomicrobiae bacterium]|nr:response regulator transcription factor [Verrucomicrobiae bacterium]
MKKILVIEDEPQMRRNICTILKMEGFAFLSADNGRKGVELAKAESPDLILCDVMMPGLNGYGVLEALRKDNAAFGVPFIFLTAKGEPADFRAGMNLGADDYLTKPVSAGELLAAINARLQRHKEQERSALENAEFKPNFDSAKPLETLGLTPREAEVLLWVAQGKSNADIGIILGMSEGTAKKHLEHIFEKLGIESRNAATVRALEVLSGPVT